NRPAVQIQRSRAKPRSPLPLAFFIALCVNRIPSGAGSLRRESQILSDPLKEPIELGNDLLRRPLVRTADLDPDHELEVMPYRDRAEGSDPLRKFLQLAGLDVGGSHNGALRRAVIRLGIGLRR